MLGQAEARSQERCLGLPTMGHGDKHFIGCFPGTPAQSQKPGLPSALDTGRRHQERQSNPLCHHQACPGRKTKLFRDHHKAPPGLLVQPALSEGTAQDDGVDSNPACLKELFPGVAKLWAVLTDLTLLSSM